MVLGVVGLLLSLIPCVGWIGLPLSGLGLVLGVVGGVVAVARKGHGVGFPIAGSAISGLALAIGGFWLLLTLRFSGAFDDTTKASVAAYQGPAPPPTQPPLGSAARPAGLNEPVMLDDLRITLTRAAIVPNDQGLKTLAILQKIENRSQTKVIDVGSTMRSGATDEFGNSLPFRSLGESSDWPGFPKDFRIFPGKAIEYTDCYEPPILDAKTISFAVSYGAGFFSEGKTAQFRFPVPPAAAPPPGPPPSKDADKKINVTAAIDYKGFTDDLAGQDYDVILDNHTDRTVVVHVLLFETNDAITPPRREAAPLGRRWMVLCGKDAKGDLTPQDIESHWSSVPSTWPSDAARWHQLKTIRDELAPGERKVEEMGNLLDDKSDLGDWMGRPLAPVGVNRIQAWLFTDQGTFIGKGDVSVDPTPRKAVKR